jgi:hypothetical protein
MNDDFPDLILVAGVIAIYLIVSGRLIALINAVSKK